MLLPGLGAIGGLPPACGPGLLDAATGGDVGGVLDVAAAAGGGVDAATAGFEAWAAAFCAPLLASAAPAAEAVVDGGRLEGAASLPLLLSSIPSNQLLVFTGLPPAGGLELEDANIAAPRG